MSCVDCWGHFQFWRDFPLHRNVAGRETPRQSRPICSHNIRRALPTTHHLGLLGPHSLVLGLVIGFRSSSAQRFLSSELLLESSLRTSVGQLGTLVCNYIQSIFVYILYIYTFVGMELTRDTIIIVNRCRRTHRPLVYAV